MKAGEFSRPCSGVTTQRSNKFRSQGWEDQAPEETPQRRVQQPVPAPGRAAAATTEEKAEAGPAPRFSSSYDPPSHPAGGWVRVLKTLAALLLLGALSAGAYLLKSALERDNRFRIAGAGNIQASGLTEVTRAEMLPVFGEDIGRNIFFVPLAERRRQLEQIPWIEHATVMRLLPDQIRVSIVERQPVAFVRQGGQVGLVDSNGVLLTMRAAMMAQHHYSFPVLTGIAAQDSPAAAKMRMGVYQRLLAELDGNGRRLSEQISEIDLTDPEDARVVMPEQGADILAHFGEDQFLARYQRYKAHIAEWRQQYPKLMAVDLRYDQQVVLKMTPGAGGAETTETDARPKTLVDPTQAQLVSAPQKPSAGIKATAARAASPKPSRTIAHKAPAKPKSAKEKKREEEARRAEIRRQKSTHTPHPAAGNGQGQ